MILVIANYRTGSSTLVKELCDKHNYTHSKYTGELFNKTMTEYHPPVHQKQVIKVMPTQVKDKKIFRDFLNASEKIYYTVRKDFIAQCCSYQLAHENNSWHPKHIEHHNHIKNPVEYDFIDNIKPKVFSLLKSNLVKQSELFREWPGELVYLEDRIQKPYNIHSYINKPTALKEHIDVESYFETQ